MILKDKKVIVIGDKDGVPGPNIEACAISAGAEVVFTTTECFSCSLVGAIGAPIQQKIKEITDKYGAENIVVLIGGSEAETSSISAETVCAGDPTETGPLTGIQLGLRIYHVLEETIKKEFNPEVYSEQCGIMEMVLNAYEIEEALRSVREKYVKFKD